MSPSRLRRAQRLSTLRRRQRLRAKAAERQGQKCIYCEETFTVERLATLEHIIPQAKGGPDTEENTAASCCPCNQERGTANHDAFLRYKREARERAGNQG